MRLLSVSHSKYEPPPFHLDARRQVAIRRFVFAPNTSWPDLFRPSMWLPKSEGLAEGDARNKSGHDDAWE